MNLVAKVEKLHSQEHVKTLPDFSPGDEVCVHVKIQEGGKSRIQLFEGTCIAIASKNALNGHFRIRKVAAGGIGVERIFPYHSPNVTKVEVVNHGKSRRAKHFYLRERKGKHARVETDFSKND